MNPPYRMPPTPHFGVTSETQLSTLGEALIPGSAIEPNANYLNPTLRTHSSKFPIERELILSSNNKNASKIPLMQDTRSSGMQLLNRSSVSVGPELPPKQSQSCWNQSQIDAIHSTITGTIPRSSVNAMRLPEDITALATERDNNNSKEKEIGVKKSVTKTYHTLKDLISSKFNNNTKKDLNDICDELNNVTVMQQQPHPQQDEYRSPYMPVPRNMTSQMNQTPQNTNMWNGRATMDSPLYYHKKFVDHSENYVIQSKAISQPQLNILNYENRSAPQRDLNDVNGISQIDATDSDEGGFMAIQHRIPQQQQPTQHHATLHQHQQIQNYNELSYAKNEFSDGQKCSQAVYFQHTTQKIIQEYPKNTLQVHQPHQHLHNNLQNQIPPRNQGAINNIKSETKLDINKTQEENRSNQQQQQNLQNMKPPLPSNPPSRRTPVSLALSNSNHTQIENDNPDSRKPPMKQPGSATSSDYDKSGNQSSNVDSGRGSAAYSSDRKAALSTSPEVSDIPVSKSSTIKETEWIDVVDAELRNILEPGIQNMTIRPESTMSGSVSSMSPPLPPLSPDGSVTYNNNKTKHKTAKTPEYGTDTYNRAGQKPQPIGPSKGYPSHSIQSYMQNLKLTSGKKQEQAMIKKHLFGLDLDGTSVTNTTRSLDLESLLGGPWEAGQSVSDSETDAQGLRQIRHQLEGLETMYSEVLKMLGARGPQAGHLSLSSSRRRRHGSLSSLPSSSVSGRPIRDRRRTEERRKVRDIKGINKRFQRLESHVVTLARSVAHLSSEMRSQHLVSQELEEIRNDIAMLRSQTHPGPFNRTNQVTMNQGPSDPLNLTNPKRVKKLTKFFGEDPPLMRLFLKKLGYEKYAPLFESERVGMIELPYLGEERLQKLGVPLGPRLRILQEAQISLCKDTTLCIV